MSGQTYPFVSIIVVNYHERALTVECLKSLRALDYPAGRFGVIVIDNASRDGSVEEIAGRFPGVKVIANRTNRGFTGGVNQGIRCALPYSEYIALVNNDSVVDKHWLSALVRTMEENPSSGCCGAKEESYGNKVAITRLPFEGNWMGGGSVLYRKSALEDVGLFDEYYFAYCEDIDLSWRMKMRGWKILCCTDALWFHHGAGRSITACDKRLFLSMRNRLYLLLKFAGARQICRSLARYAGRVAPGGRNGHFSSRPDGDAAVVKTPLRNPRVKLLYAARAVIEVVLIMPVLVTKRINIYRRSRVSGAQIDSWIQANDAYVTLNF